MNPIDIITQEIARLKQLANQDKLTDKERENSFTSSIKPQLDQLKCQFEEVKKDEVFFDVHREQLYRQKNSLALGIKNKQFFGIIHTQKDYVISCVDNGYVLISNKDVLQYATLLFCHLFENQTYYSVSLCRQSTDKSESDFYVQPPKSDCIKDISDFCDIRDAHNRTWNFFLRVSNTYYNNVKKFSVGFVSNDDLKVILPSDNGLVLEVKANSFLPDFIPRLIYKQIINKNLGNYIEMKRNYLTTLYTLTQTQIPLIYIPFFLVGDCDIKNSVEYVEKINKKIVISKDQRQRYQSHLNRIKSFYEFCGEVFDSDDFTNDDTLIKTITIYDLFIKYIKSDFIRETDKNSNQVIYREFYYPTKAGEWLDKILSRIEQPSNDILSNYKLIQRINNIDNQLFKHIFDKLNYYFENTIEKLSEKIYKSCSAQSYGEAFKIKEAFENEPTIENFFRCETKLSKILIR